MSLAWYNLIICIDWFDWDIVILLAMIIAWKCAISKPWNLGQVKVNFNGTDMRYLTDLNDQSEYLCKSKL